MTSPEIVGQEMEVSPQSDDRNVVEQSEEIATNDHEQSSRYSKRIRRPSLQTYPIATTGETTLIKEGESVMTEFTTHPHDGPRCVMYLIGMLK